MRKFIVLMLFIGSIVLFAWSINKYATSGEEISAFALTQGQSVLPPVHLDVSMSPVRAILGVSYEMQVTDGHSDAYKYRVNIKDPASTEVIAVQHTQSEKKEDQETSFQQKNSNHIIGTFPVNQSGAYLIEWDLWPKKAKITKISLQLRRNVAPLDWVQMTIAGVLFALGWFVLFTGRRAKT